MKTRKPDISISTKYPEIDIDFSRCRSEMGYPSLPEAVVNWRDEGKQAASDYIDTKVAEGNALADIHKGISVQDIAYNQAFPGPPDFNVDFIPKSRPNITARPGKVTIDYTPGDIAISTKPFPVSFSFDRAKVDIFLDKKPYIDIKAVYVGKNFDKRI